jgi:hypothetical protein
MSAARSFSIVAAHLFVHTLQQRVEKFVFRLEVIVKHADIHARMFGQRAHRQSRATKARKQFAPRLQQGLIDVL